MPVTPRGSQPRGSGLEGTDGVRGCPRVPWVRRLARRVMGPQQCSDGVSSVVVGSPGGDSVPRGYVRVPRGCAGAPGVCHCPQGLCQPTWQCASIPREPARFPRGVLGPQQRVPGSQRLCQVPRGVPVSSGEVCQAPSDCASQCPQGVCGSVLNVHTRAPGSSPSSPGAVPGTGWSGEIRRLRRGGSRRSSGEPSHYRVPAAPRGPLVLPGG